jgi:hypothetical protein
VFTQDQVQATDLGVRLGQRGLGPPQLLFQPQNVFPEPTPPAPFALRPIRFLPTTIPLGFSFATPRGGAFPQGFPKPSWGGAAS